MSQTPHGNSAVYWQQNVLIIKPSGIFNLEGIRHVAQKVNQCIEQRPKGKWARCVVFEDTTTIGPMDSLPLVVEQYKKSKEIGCIAVFSTGGSALNQHNMREVCEGAEMPYEHHPSLESTIVAAEALLQSQTDT